MRRQRAAWGWFLFLLAFASGSLLVYSRLRPASAASTWHPVSRAISGFPSSFQTLNAVYDPGRKCFVFNVPVSDAMRDRTAQLHFRLKSDLPFGDGTVQVLVEGDHHRSFAHLYRVPFSVHSGFVFSTPLGQEPAYWQSLDQSGPWTVWERSGMRRLEIKVFGTPAKASLKIEYAPVLCAEVADRPVTVLWAVPLADPVPVGRRFELAFDLNGMHANPFDGNATGVRMIVSNSTGATVTVHPFLYQNFELITGRTGETIRPKGPKHFRARYRPAVDGDHTYRLVYASPNSNKESLLAQGRFRVTPGAVPDFIRISPRNPRYFEHADGRFFYPIGWNMAYPMDTPYGIDYLPYLPAEQSLTAMQKMLGDLADAGGNCIRFWQSSWWNGLEWDCSADQYQGIGRYNLKNAWLTDQVLDTCEQRGIRLLFTMINHTRLTMHWGENPYFRRNGGFLSYAQEFWTQDAAIEPTQQQLAYAIARFADSPACLSWDFMSEVDLTSGGVWPQTQARVLAMLTYMREQDPYDHIVANHICMVNHDFSFYDLPSIEFIQSNAYPGLGGLSDDQVFAIRDFSEYFTGKTKPVLVSECAGHWAGDPAYKMKRDTLGAIWAGIASRLSGVPQSWWWNFNYGEDLGRWYRVIADFMAGEDLIAQDSPAQGDWRNRRVTCDSSSGNLRALMVGNGLRRFLFAFNYDTICRTRLIPSPCASNTITFAAMAPGSYVAEYWDPQAGKTGIRQVITVADDSIGVLHPPEFSESWMIKLYRNELAITVADPPSILSAPASPLPPKNTINTSRPSSNLTWSIEPLVPVLAEEAVARSFHEVRIALPAEARGQFPSVLDSDGNPALFQWHFLDDQAGWRIHIPGQSKGPFLVKAVSNAPPAEWSFDPMAVGLEVETAHWSGRRLRSPAQFTNAFFALPDRRRARMAAIDQLENPLGDNDEFLAVYRGPILIPVDGEYTFALNTDDGGFLKLDNQTVVRWPGPHNMELTDKPIANTWTHRGTLPLTRGLHWLECYHQEEHGAQLARAGWSLPAAFSATNELMASLRAAETVSTATCAVIPPQVLDGRIPCRIRVLADNQPVADIIECMGLHLRRPATNLYAATVREPSSTVRRTRYFNRAGAQVITVNQQPIPVWVHNEYWAPFSMDWEQGRTEAMQPVFKTIVFDRDLPVRLRIGAREAGEQLHRARCWQVWKLEPSDTGQPFVLSVAGLDCLRGVIAEWTLLAPPDPSPAAPRYPPTRLLYVGTVFPPPPLSGQDLSSWIPPEPGPGTATPEDVIFNVWTESASALQAQLEMRDVTGTGVILALDRIAYVMGLSGEEVYRRLHAHIRAIRAAGAIPILRLDPALDLMNPLMQRQALALARLRDEFRCPLIERRRVAP